MAGQRVRSGNIAGRLRPSRDARLAALASIPDRGSTSLNSLSNVAGKGERKGVYGGAACEER
jgi:hypothetical protein